MVNFFKKYTDCCGYSELYKDNELIMSGDYYHDKITDKIEGYLKAYKDLNLDYIYSIEKFKKCPYDCE